MAYSVDIIYSKNQDFSNPLTETEAGQPQSVELTNLDSNETYYTKAVLKNNGTVEDESTVETFATLPAGTIALTHQSSARQGGDYVVVYTYTSTYALSSSVLRCGATIAAQGVISGNTITYTVSGLTPGDAYIYDITTIDIYAETNNITGSLVMPVVNIVAISLQEALADEISFDLDYTVDSGMVSGYLNYWLGSDDPSTDQPQGHFHFSYGDTDVTADGLTAGTSYKFRAEIVLNDGQSTEIVSNVVSASTTVDYTTQYLTITNTDSTNGNLSVVRVSGNTSTGAVLQYTLDGNTWQNYTTFSSQSIEVPSGGSVSFKGNFTKGLCNANNTFKFGGSFECVLSGNPFSLRNTNPNTFKTYTSTLPYEFFGLFSGLSHLTSAENLATSQITVVGNYAFENAFRVYGSTLSVPPDFSGVETVGDFGFSGTFYGLSNLTTPPNLSRVTTVGEGGMSEMLYGCTSLTTPPNLSNVTSTAEGSFQSMFWGDTSLRTAPSFSGITAPTKRLFESTFYGCTSLVESPDFRGITRMLDIEEKAFYMAFAGCTNLSKVCAPAATSWDRNKFRRWLENVSASGTLYKNANLTTLPANDTSGLPSGWTTQDY